MSAGTEAPAETPSAIAMLGTAKATSAPTAADAASMATPAEASATPAAATMTTTAAMSATAAASVAPATTASASATRLHAGRQDTAHGKRGDPERRISLQHDNVPFDRDRSGYSSEIKGAGKDIIKSQGVISSDFRSDLHRVLQLRYSNDNPSMLHTQISEWWRAVHSANASCSRANSPAECCRRGIRRDLRPYSVQRSRGSEERSLVRSMDSGSRAAYLEASRSPCRDAHACR
jgi:hypothetical protein